MAFTRALRAVVGTALAGGIVLAASPAATADQARDAQWALTQYEAATNVWPVSTGKGVTVAVIDTGVRATNVDLKGNVLAGKDFLTAGGNGWTDHSAAGEGHGTAVASIIAAHGHGPGGSEGIKGLAPDAKILPIVINGADSPQGKPGSAGVAIRYAVDHGAKIINMSFGGDIGGDDEKSAIAYAEAHDVVLVAAAGNDGSEGVDYPAGYPGVVSVGGMTENDKIWSGSNYGKITVTAPAVGIVGDNDNSDTAMGKGDGTSFATPYVSAEAADIWAKYPQLTAGQVINRIIKTANLPSGLHNPDAKWGYGAAIPSNALTKNIPVGPAAGPLPQMKETSAAGNGLGGSAASSPAQASGGDNSSKSSSTGTVIGIVVGVVVVAAIVVVIVLMVRRRNRNSGGGSGGPGGGGGFGGGQPSPSYPAYGQPQQTSPGGGYQQPSAGAAGNGGGQSVAPNNPYAQPQPPYGNPQGYGGQGGPGR